jgi:hypothetical protein
MDVARTRLDGAGPVRKKPVTVTESDPMLRSHHAWDEAVKLRWKDYTGGTGYGS